MEKLGIALQAMEDLEIYNWIIVSDEGSDKTIYDLTGFVDTSICVLIISKGLKRLIVSSLDRSRVPMNVFSPDEILVFSRDKKRSFEDCFIEVLNSLDLNGGVHLNYATSRRIILDRIRAGQRDMISNYLNKVQVGFDSIYSAEKLLISIYERKSIDEIEKMRIACERAEFILSETFKRIGIGMTERDGYNLVRNIMAESRESFMKENLEVISEDVAWNGGCPICLTGKSWLKGGHAMTSDEKIVEGNTIYFDFGVKLGFSDGTYYCSDIQRVAYVLRDGEVGAPEDVQKMFDTIILSIDRGIEKCRPGVLGKEVDRTVREIVCETYPDYDHSTGHPIGIEAHDVGTLIGPNSDSEIQLYGTYTIEPRIQVENGISVEEDVYVGENETISLSPRQKELVLISFSKSL